MEGEPLLRQTVLVPRRTVAVAAPTDHAIAFQPLETAGEKMGRHPRLALEFLETSRSQEELAQDEHRPAVSDNRECTRDGADGASNLGPAHIDSLQKLK